MRSQTVFRYSPGDWVWVQVPESSRHISWCLAFAKVKTVLFSGEDDVCYQIVLQTPPAKNHTGFGPTGDTITVREDELYFTWEDVIRDIEDTRRKVDAWQKEEDEKS